MKILVLLLICGCSDPVPDFTAACKYGGSACQKDQDCCSTVCASQVCTAASDAAADAK